MSGEASVEKLIDQPYKYGFVANIEEEKSRKELMKTQSTSSQQKNEPNSCSNFS